MIIGFLMVGGASSRMRRNKALLPWPSAADLGQCRSLADHLSALLATKCSEVCIVGRPAISLPDTLSLPDAVDGIGPLGGLLSALRHLSARYASQQDKRSASGDPEGWALLLSCDTPFVHHDLISQLIDAAQAPAASSRGPDVVLPRTRDGRLHPLCAIYHARVTSELETLLADAVRDADNAERVRAPSMHRFVQSLAMVSVTPRHDRWLRNLNSMQDYLAALAEG